VSDSETSDRWRVGAASLLIVGTVVAVDPGGWFPFGPLRWMVVSTSLLLLAAATLRRPVLQIHRESAAGWLVFLTLGVVSSLVALDPLYTWLGTPDRHMGMVTATLFAVAFFAGQNLTGDRAERGLLQAASAALLIIGVYTALEVIDLAPVDQATPSGRPGGPFGSAAYLGAACALLIPIGVAAAADGLGSAKWRYVAIGGALLGGFAALASQTRAGWVGLAAAIAISLPALSGWIRRNGIIVVTGVVALVLAAMVTPIGSRAIGAFDFSDGTARGRLDEWQVGAAVVVNHPVTGVGFEGYRIAFSEGVDADYERRYTRVTMPDRAHSGPLDVGATTGLLGMVIYLAAVGFLARRAWRAVGTRRARLGGVAAGVVGYLAQQLFLFPLAEIDPLFWLFAGVLVAATSQRAAARVRPARWLWPVTAALAVAALVIGALDVAADRRLALAGDLADRGEVDQAYEATLDAAALRPDSIRYHFAAAAAAGSGGSPEWLDRALVKMHDALEVSPGDPILRAEHASFLLRLAQALQDGGLLADATDEWEALVEDDPFHARYRLELGNSYALGGNSALAEAQWLITADLAPRSTAPFTNLAILYIEEGRLDAARSALDQAKLVSPGAAEIAVIEELLRNQ